MKHPSIISISEFTYELPQEKIAQYPLAKRDESKLLIFKNGEIKESVFKNLYDFLSNESILVFNNTKVIQARLNFKNDKGKNIEIFCLEPAADLEISMAMLLRGNATWNCLVGNLKHWKENVLIDSKNGLSLTVKIKERKENYVVIDFSWSNADISFAEVLESVGAMPIPPYLKRLSDKVDTERYQTIYAKEKGSVAAPTAGLHFTEQTLDYLKRKRIKRTEVTLHVGAGTFKPVKSPLMQGHEMHAEWIEVRIETIDILIEHLNKKVIAVGTTSLRTIESLYWMGLKILSNPNADIEDIEIKQWDPYDFEENLPDAHDCLIALRGWMDKKKLRKILCKTSILIAPPYDLKIAKGIITNFHQPQSTLLLLISAVVGNKWREIYEYALKNDFRFLSYGDSSLLFK